MKQAGMITGTMLFLLTAAVIAAERKPGFRQASWGMTPAEVKKTETRAEAVPGSPPSELWYSDSLIGAYPARVLYVFAQGKLVRGAYLLGGPRRPTDYDYLQNLLIAKYGPPADVSPLNPFGERETTWEAGATEISLLEKRDGNGAGGPGEDRRENARPATSLEINYYGVAGARKDAARYRRTAAADRLTDAVIREVIEDWHEVAPGVWEWNEM